MDQYGEGSCEQTCIQEIIYSGALPFLCTKKTCVCVRACVRARVLVTAANFEGIIAVSMFTRFSKLNRLIGPTGSSCVARN